MLTTLLGLLLGTLFSRFSSMFEVYLRLLSRCFQHFSILYGLMEGNKFRWRVANTTVFNLEKYVYFNLLTRVLSWNNCRLWQGSRCCHWVWLWIRVRSWLRPMVLLRRENHLCCAWYYLYVWKPLLERKVCRLEQLSGEGKSPSHHVTPTSIDNLRAD